MVKVTHTSVCTYSINDRVLYFSHLANSHSHAKSKVFCPNCNKGITSSKYVK